ncbi:MAG: hypothetical protein WA653_06035 [Candidatus Sulfotelmatobacter sp.]
MYASLALAAAASNRYLAMSAGARTTRGMDEKINILMVDDQPDKLLTYEAILSELERI